MSSSILNFIRDFIDFDPESNEDYNLDLDDVGIETIPDDIGDLNESHVSEINLSNNEITSLPDSIGKLKKIDQLYLSHNELVVLPETIGDLTALKYLYIDRNSLTSLPESIGKLGNLEKLIADRNQFTSIPESIGNLENLEEINLSFNDLTSLPESFGNLRNLEILDFDGNQLASLPESIGNLQNLHYLSLHGNNLVSLPESIGNLINLETLNLSGNLNLRSLPESIVNLTHVDLEISITDTAITSLPENLPENIMIFGFRQQRHAAVAAPEPQVDAYQIHRASSKIDYEKLVAFLKSKLGNLEFPANLNYPSFINETLSTFIRESNESEEEKTTLSEGLSRIMNERLNGLNYALNSPLLNQSIFYTLEYIKKKTQEFKNAYVATFIKDCVEAYNGPDGMTCAAGALERIVFSLETAIVASSPENPDDQQILDIITANPDKLVVEYIQDWYRLHKKGTPNAFTNETEEEKKRDLMRFLITKMPLQNPDWIRQKISEIADYIGYEEDDFLYGGRKRRTKKSRNSGKRGKKTLKKKSGNSGNKKKSAKKPKKITKKTKSKKVRKTRK
jgi:hypothetical protein